MSPKVSIVKGKNPRHGVRKAIELLGGIESFVKKGDTVFIKPNWVYLSPPNLTTDPRVVAELAALCKEAGGKPFVGDIPAIGVSSKWLYQVTGWGKIVEKAGGKLVPLDEMPKVRVKVEEGKLFKEIDLPKPIIDADVFVDVPVAKTHIAAVASLGIKNLLGILDDRWKYIHHRDDLHQKMVDLLKAVSPDLVVIDGIKAGEGQGPANCDWIEWGVIIAGDNIISTDAVAARAMGFDPMEVHMVRIGAAQGLGEADLNKIEVLGAKIEDVERRFKRPITNPTGFYPFDVFTSGWCDGCRAWISASLDGWAKDGTFRKLAKKTNLTIAVGCRVTIPEIERRIKQGPVIVFGDCAPEETKHHPGVTNIPGCPPTSNLTSDFLNALRKYGIEMEKIRREKE